jgi:hypothetical protein
MDNYNYTDLAKKQIAAEKKEKILRKKTILFAKKIRN